MFKRPKLALGVLQRNITYIDGFPRWGCFVACILTAIQRSLKRALYPHEIQQWYNECVRRGAILHNKLPKRRGVNWYRCFVVDRIQAFNIGMKMFGGARHATAITAKHKTNLRVYRWKTPFGYHFTYGSPERNLHDPDPRLKLLRRAGQRDMHVMEGQTDET